MQILYVATAAGNSPRALPTQLPLYVAINGILYVYIQYFHWRMSFQGEVDTSITNILQK